MNITVKHLCSDYHGTQCLLHILFCFSYTFIDFIKPVVETWLDTDTHKRAIKEIDKEVLGGLKHKPNSKYLCSI
jgi:hypothetical protein